MEFSCARDTGKAKRGEDGIGENVTELDDEDDDNVELLLPVLELFDE